MANDINYNNAPDISGIKQSEDYRRSKQEQQEMTAGEKSRLDKLKDTFSGWGVRFTVGLTLGLTALFLFVSFFSFFLNGAGDQSRVENYSTLQNAAEPEQISNWGAALGAAASQFFIADGVGIVALLLAVWCGVVGYRMMKRDRQVRFVHFSTMIFVSILVWSIVIGAITYFMSGLTFPYGGYFGYFVNKWIYGFTGLYGMVAVSLILFVVWCFVFQHWIVKLIESLKGIHISRPGSDNDDDDEPDGEDHFDAVGDDVTEPAKPRPNRVHTPPVTTPAPTPSTATPPATETTPAEPAPAQTADKTETTPPKPRTRKPAVQTDGEPEMQATEMTEIEQVRTVTNPGDPTGEYIHYVFPSLDLLSDKQMNTTSVDVAEQEYNKERITKTLGDFGIEIKKIEVHVGPTVTLFEIVPVDGTRVSKVKNLEDDIALSLKAIGIRIIAPMPGRGTIGIEIPNQDPQVVPMRQVLASKAFQESKAKLPMCLGCTVSNEVFVADLTKMPHLLVAGATGKGKSVGLNAIITSLLYKKGPSELKFVLVDPKRVEFSIYADLEKYFLAIAPDEERAIITDTARVVHTLNCLVQEMEDRYEVLEQVKVRNVVDYNDKWRRELREIRNEFGEPVYQYMPYIVAIVDEFSDMIMTAGKEVETPIVRIAQKARAVGIHMIIATQRPSAQVITGLIKTNFPGRIAFAVSGLVDSRIILDQGGAQRLIGRGDMLFQVDGETTRLQCPFVDTPEVEAVCSFIKEQEDNDKNVYHDKTFELPEYSAPGEGGGASGDVSNVKDRDPLFEQALRMVVSGDTASTSSLQRTLEIGYNRAGRIMDQLEAAGIVGPAVGGKPRKVLVNPLDVDQILSTMQ